MRTITLLLILLLFSWVVKSQTTEKVRNNRIHAYAGIAGGKWKDEGYSPLLYSMNSAQFDLFYQRIVEKDDFLELRFNAQLGQLSHENLENFTSDYVSFQFEVAYLWQLLTVKNWNFYAGAHYRLGTNLTTWEDEYGFSSTHSYYNENSFSPLLQAQYNREKIQFTTRFQMPVISFASRPPYTTITDQDDGALFSFSEGDWNTVNNHISPQLELIAAYKIAPWFSLNGKLKTAYSQYNRHHKIAYNTTSFSVGTQFTF